LVIGVTGGVGSGKSTVVRYLAETGWQIIDVDILAREIIENDSSILEKIRTTFGKEYIDTGMHLRRRELGRRVFSDPEAIKQLNQIVWPVLIPALKKRINHLKAEAIVPIVADIAILFEAECQDLFDVIIVVTASMKERKKRLMKQRDWTSEEIRHCMASQISDAEKKRQADYIIRNNGREEDLQLKTHDLIKWLGEEGQE
jgi:dephospho-CoA kinase